MTPSLLAHGDPELVWVAAVFLLWLGVVALGLAIALAFALVAYHPPTVLFALFVLVRLRA